MSKDSKVAVVTGSNKGIGFAIVKGLCEKYDGIVYLTSRNKDRGLEAVQKLEKLGHKPRYYQLDIEDTKSIEQFKQHIEQTHGGIDLLVNNAAIAFKVNATESFAEQAEKTIEVNYFATLKVCDILFPLLKPNARVVHISSSCGHLSKIPSEELREKLSNPALTVEQLNNLMKDFVNAAKENKNVERGWGTSAYNVSKVGVSALTVIQQREFDREEPNRNVSVNCCHPGYVDTDMTSHKGPLTIEEGAKAPLYLSLESHNLKGKYVWYDTQVVDWKGNSTPTPW